jgi:hypothetical protein
LKQKSNIGRVKESDFRIIDITSFINFNKKIMKNIIALGMLVSILTISCTEEKAKNVAPADYAETEQKLLKNK